jgi:anti-anti-sigma factor
MNNLEINQEKQDDEIILHCSGRLDANSAGYLDDYINRLVREGYYLISLDLLEIEYLSSAGIRSLVTQYKNLNAINGHFSIPKMSKNVNQVLGMVGMVAMLSQPILKNEPVQQKKGINNLLQAYGFNFNATQLNSEAEVELNLYGKPELIQQSAFTSDDAKKTLSGENHFAIGLGAIGDSFDECKNRFGEYIMLGKNVAYLPADGSKKPDYMVSSGQLIASLTELYGLHFNGDFASVIRFYSDNQQTIGLSKLIESIKKITLFENLAFVMISESGGMVGTSLNASPVNGRNLFSFPDVKETVNFTTEPAHLKMLTLSVGVAFSDKNETIKKFIRPMEPGSTILGHVHTAVFPYIPLKKTDIDLNETIDYLFNNAELTDILHLTNDKRDIVGIGESQFVHGFLWIVPIGSTNVISN